jgi:hypothetical protein
MWSGPTSLDRPQGSIVLIAKKYRRKYRAPSKQILQEVWYLLSLLTGCRD